MQLTKTVFLIGMPGAGKTWWGSRLALKYSLPFIDLDTFIEQQENVGIPALFASYGETGFREREHIALQKLLADLTFKGIVACGGGTPCFAGNMELMKTAGVVIYLRTAIATLINNMNNSAAERPMLKGKDDPAGYLADLLKERQEFYGQAHFILQTEDISVSTFAEIIGS